MYYSDDDNDYGRNAAFELSHILADDPGRPALRAVADRPVITKAQELFGFRCAVGLEEGL